MSNSLLTGVSGLRVHQQMLDVVGNNLANLNTPGFKSQATRFSDLVYQTLTQAAAANENSGGVNPMQVGLGVKLASIDTNLQQGSLQSTDNVFDLALEGNGYFVANDGIQNHFTRAGAFGVDSSNFLDDPSTGYRVQRFGTVGEASATSPAFQTAGNNNIKIPIGTGIPGKATTTITLQGNLSAGALGPLAQVLTSAQPFLSGGGAATTSTLLNNLDDNQVDYASGDQIHLVGRTSANAPVDVLVGVDDTTTLGDIISAINANFTDSTASLDANGNIVIQANSTGPSFLNVSLTDAGGNTGSTVWGNHSQAITTTGKDGDIVTTGIQFYDTQGTAHYLNIDFQKQANNTWNLHATMNASEGTLLDDHVDGIVFNDDGSFRFVNGTGAGDPFLTAQITGLSSTQTIGFNFGATNGFDGLTQVGGTSSAIAKDQDGFAAGFLTGVSVSQDGIISGTFTNGRVLAIAQIAIANFANPAALLREGNSYFGLSSESGTPLIGTGLTGGRGLVQQKTLESSNVDVSLEFTRMIIAQRGFQVNARTITASNEVLQELASIIR